MGEEMTFNDMRGSYAIAGALALVSSISSLFLMRQHP
jgi:hypothetical protein